VVSEDALLQGLLVVVEDLKFPEGHRTLPGHDRNITTRTTPGMRDEDWIWAVRTLSNSQNLIKKQ
jgi:hypothetical protein